MKTILQEKVTIHYSIKNLVHKFIPIPHAIKILAAKAAAGQGMGKIGEIFGVVLDKKSEVRSDRWSKNVGRYSPFCITDGHMSFEECWIGGKTPRIHRSNCTSRWYCERWFWILCSIHWTRIISISKWQQQRSRKSYPDCQDVQDKQLTQYLLIPGKNGRCFNIIFQKIPKSECPDIWTRLPQHKWPKSWSSMEDPVVPLERNLLVILWQDCYGKGKLRKFYWKNCWEKVSNEECSFVHREKKGVILMFLCWWHQICWKQNIDPMWIVLDKEVVLG